MRPYYPILYSCVIWLRISFMPLMQVEQLDMLGSFLSHTQQQYSAQLADSHAVLKIKSNLTK